jgi:signal transduction histidine kinase
VGAAVGALAEPIGVSVRSRNGWFRTMFNIANGFLANVAAWAVFRWIYGPGAVPDLAAGLAAGFVHFTVNSGLVVLVIRVSDRSAPMSRVLRARLSVLPYSIGYGFAAFAFVNMNDTAGAVGFMALLAPVILLHGFLIRYTRNVHEGEVERAAHQMERDRLLLQEFEASERERVKLQADLHDGVVQNLTGLQLALHNGAAHLRREPAGVEDREELLELLEQSAAETRVAMKDLRTLMVDLAPPTLRKEGLEAALLEVLREIKRKGTNTQLDLPPNLRLRKDRAELIFIVAQEMLRNVAAHAHAKNVNVELTTEDGSAILSIQDDGKGFTAADTERRRAEGHLGTSTSVDRVEAVGGTLITDSEPGRGTLVVLSLPIE